MKILAFAGSNSQKSINKQLVTFAVQKMAESDAEILDLNDFEVPIYSPEREAELGIPERILALSEKMAQADLLIISLAEHNGSYSTAFKNVFDWLSRIPNRKVFREKKLFLLSTSPGARGGQSVLETASNRFPRDGADLVATYSLPSFYEHFDAEKGIQDVVLLGELETKIRAIKNLF